MTAPPPVSPRLWTQLGPLLPDARQTSFLRACVTDDAAAAWARWRGAAGDEGPALRRELAAFGSLLPLLRFNLERNGVAVEGSLATLLRTAQLTEELRWDRYRAICASAFDVLHEAAGPFVVLKGAALAETVYPFPVLRHSDDVDLLLHAADLPRAAAACGARGWQPTPPSDPPSVYHWPLLRHESGLPLELHFRLLPPFYTLPHADLWARADRAAIAARDVAVLSPADALLHVCAHAMLGGPNVRWVPDAWFIVQRHADLSWPLLLSTARASRLALPLYLALSYLAQEIGLPVPADALESLRASAARTDVRGRSAIRLGIPPPAGTAREIWASGSSAWRRLGMLLRRAFPPPLEYALRHDLRWWQLPAAYVRRLARHARA